jgi:hypothetical protein
MIIENWALKKVAEEISNLAFDYISSCLQENAHNVFTKIRLYHMKKRIKKWCDDFLIKHDGTVLTEGRFIRFLSTYRVFEEILTYSNANISDLSEDEFIKGLLKKTKTGISGKLSPTDEMLIKEFYEKLLKRFNECWLSLLSNSEQQLLHRMSVQNASLRDTINSLNYKNQSILEKNGSQISEKDTISLFEELNKRYWDGEFDFLHNILTLIEKRSDSLEYWIKLSLDLALEKKIYNIDVSAIDGISINIIKFDAVRKWILFSYLCGDNSKIGEVVDNGNKELNSLAKDLSINRIIFNREVDHKNHTDLIQIQIPERYKKEMWLTKRVLSIYLSKQSLTNSFEVINKLMGGESDFLISIIKFNQLIEERISGSNVVPNDNIKKEFEILWYEKKQYIELNHTLQTLFLKSCILYALKYDDNKLSAIIGLVEESDNKDEKLQELVMLTKIEQGTIAYTEILSACKKSGRFELLNDYFVSLNNPTQVEKLIREDAIELLMNPIIFFAYIRALRFMGRDMDALRLLDEKRDLFSDYLEYWIEKVKISNSEEDVDQLEKLWFDEAGKAIFPISDDAVADIMYKHNRFNACIQIVNAIETRNRVTNNDLCLKAASYFSLENKLEAYKILRGLFEKGDRSTYVVYNFSATSLELKRDIGRDVEKALSDINSSYSLLLLAKIFERKDDRETARTLYIKSLLKNQGDNDLVYAYYLDFFWKFNFKETKGIAENTTIYLTSTISNKQLVVSVCANDLILQESHKWNDTFIISRDIAIKNELLRKNIEDSINYNGEEYRIDNIIPFERYLAGICMNKMIDEGYAKVCQSPTDVNDKELLDFLTQWLIDNTNIDKKADGFSDYENLEKLPMTIFCLSKSSKPTYEELVMKIIENDSMIIREEYDFDKERVWNYESKFVLSFFAVSLLFKMGVDVSFLNRGNVFIPKSLLRELQEEKNKILKEYDQDRVYSAGIIDKKLYINETNETTKSRQMKYAIDFLDYCSSIPQIENESSIEFREVSTDKLLDLFGVVDYDAIALCKQNEYVLVGVEMLLTFIEHISEPQCSVSNIIEFLNQIVNDDSVLITYMTKMVQYRVINLINQSTLLRVIKSTDKKVDRLWINFLKEINRTQGPYRKLMLTELSFVGKKIMEISEPPIGGRMQMLIYLLIKLRPIKLEKVEYRINDGEIEIEMYYEPYKESVENNK